jgi:hypothetical protein
MTRRNIAAHNRRSVWHDRDQNSLGRFGFAYAAGPVPYGPDTMVQVTPGDIKLAQGNPDAVFIAIHPDFYSPETPYLLTGVELPK